MYDIIIKNGKIIDGLGKTMFAGDLGIKEGKIKEIGDLHNDTASSIIDASGKYVVPGFVDVNNHSDVFWRILLNPDLESLIHQGITTVIGGNCGTSLAPLLHKDVLYSIQKWADVRGLNLNWMRMQEFLDEVGWMKMSVNFGTLVGHSTVRRGILRDDTRGFTPDEMALAKKVLGASFKEGALGFSTGLVYTHAKSAPRDEIMELAEVVAKNKGVYATHVRGEFYEVIDSLKEAIRTAEMTGVNMQISHLKVMGEKNWSLMDEALELIDSAWSRGVKINFDVFPYTSTGSVLYILLPDWVAEGGKKMMIERLKNKKMRSRVISEMQEGGVDYSKVLISISPLNKTLNRKTMTEIARLQQKPVEEAILDLLVASEGRVITMMEVLSEENVIKAIQHPLSIISSNGAGYNLDHGKTEELVHPRNFGSFPRVLARYVKKKRLLGWEEAIHKMTGKPAEKYGLKGRGSLEVGNWADIAVIDPQRIDDRATVQDPYQYPIGIDWVLVNGEVALQDGKYAGARSGQVIRRSSSWFDF